MLEAIKKLMENGYSESEAKQEFNGKFKNAEEITRFFIKDGWGENTTFSELSEKEAKEKGYYFAVDGIKNGRKYFVMGVCGNVYDDNGKIAMYNI